MPASRPTLQDIRGLVIPPPPPLPANWRQRPAFLRPSLEQYSGLLSLTLKAAHEMRSWSVPLLPDSLRTLTLDASPDIYKCAPLRLRLAHLTRLTELTLLGHASYKPLCEHWDPETEGPRLPASLVTLRLDSRHAIDLRDLARGEARLAASAPVLIARAPVICCSMLEFRPGWSAPKLAGPPLPGNPLVSELPAGFSALELHVQRITIRCSTAVAEVGPAEAAWQLCLLFSWAPASYRRISMFLDKCEEESLPFWLSYRHINQGEAEFPSVEALAECMQARAADLNLSVIVSELPVKHLVVVRT